MVRWSPGCNCCGDCVCDTEIVRDFCDCNSTDYGTETILNDVTVTVTGSASASGNASCGSPYTCPSIAGSFVHACSDTPATWVHWDFICSTTFNDIYSSVELTVDYENPGSGWQLKVEILAGFVLAPKSGGASNPYPTITKATPIILNGGGFSRLTNIFVLPLNKAYRYDTSNCDPSCPNPDVNITRCLSGSQSFTSTSSSVGVTGCDYTGLSVSIAY